MQREIDAAGLPYRVVNAGRSGDTTAGGLARLPWYLRKEMRPAVLVVQLGSNDTFRGHDLKNVEANLRNIIREARAFDPKIKVLLFQMHTLPSLGEQYTKEYAAIFPRLAKEEGVPLLPFPLAEVAGRPELNQPDGIHPTEEGAKLVAKNVWKSLREHL